LYAYLPSGNSYARFVALLVLFAICGPLPATAQRTLAVVGGAVIDSTGAPPRPNAAIVIEGDRIRAGRRWCG
jgi:hypothetical protein